MVTPPIAMIAFNRPDLTRETFAQVARAKPAHLFLICDGPRDGHPTDAERCAETRAVFDQVDWPCEVHRRFADVNGGCDKTIELGLDWLFEQVPAAIILEDDCVPDQSFFPYCAELLERYADDDKVRQIAGFSQFVAPRFFGERSYAFAPFAAVWGWATWSRAWRRHRELFSRTHVDEAERVPVHDEPVDLGSLATAGGRRYFAEVAATRDPKAFTWDSHWWVSIVSDHGLCVTPRANMVENTGFRDDATSTNSSRVMPVAEPIAFPLVHPSAVVTDVPVATETEHSLVRANGHLARRLRRLVPPGPLRTVARVLATGPATQWLVRVVTRIAAVMRAAARR